MAQQLSDADQQTLAQLKQAGSNLAKPHNINHWLYFPTRDDAQAAADELQNRGFVVDSIEPSKQEWRLLVTHSVVPSADNVAASTSTLESVAASHSGDYDGWETQVVD